MEEKNKTNTIANILRGTWFFGGIGAIIVGICLKGLTGLMVVAGYVLLAIYVYAFAEVIDLLETIKNNTKNKGE